MKQVVFLRGINVGGHKKIKMAELRELLESEGFEDVETYIQSGNIVLRAQDTKTLSDRISEMIKNHYGFEVPAIAFSASTLKAIFDACPFDPAQKKDSYFLVLFEKPDEALVEAIQSVQYPHEEFYITGKCIYLFVEQGYGKSKFNNNFFEKKLKVKATARNYNTLLKMIELATS